jgi:hypothetical protein
MINNRYTVRTEEYLWERFKLYIPKSMTINDMLVYLIAEYVDKCEKGKLSKPTELIRRSNFLKDEYQ